MKTKLTLLLPEETIRKAKRQALRRNTSVSALFRQSVEKLSEDEAREEALLEKHPQLRALVGAMEGVAAFDERSAAILSKHG